MKASKQLAVIANKCKWVIRYRGLYCEVPYNADGQEMRRMFFDSLGNLIAMREAIVSQPRSVQLMVLDNLERMEGPGDTKRRVFLAPAENLAEALVHALNKWEDK